MTTAEHHIDLADAFPGLDYRYYGRCAAWLGEDNDQAMVAGHDLRSYAALNALLRFDDGNQPMKGATDDISARWATFEESCGCTEEQHARHETEPPEGVADDQIDAAGYGDCCGYCDDYGLPPCRDDYGWLTQFHDEPKVDSVPVLVWTRDMRPTLTQLRPVLPS